MKEQDLQREYEFELAREKEFAESVKDGNCPSWDVLHWFRERDDQLPVEVATAVYNMASSAVDFEGDAAPLTYRKAVKLLWELKMFLDGPPESSPVD